MHSRGLDISLSDHTDAKTLAPVTVGTSAVELLVADRNRLVVFVSWHPGTQILTAESVRVGVLVAGVVHPLTTLTLGHPACQLRIDTYGSLVKEQIVAIATVAGQVVTPGQVTQLRSAT